MFELLGYASATFGEAGIANRFAVCQYFTARFLDRFPYNRCRSTGDTLLALAMIVGTDIEHRMIFAVVPADQLILFAVAALVFLRSTA